MFKTMTLAEGRSSNIVLVAHDNVDQLLVEFSGGGLYQYKGVPLQLAEDMVQAPSVGRFFHAHIRGRFPFRRLQSREQVNEPWLEE